MARKKSRFFTQRGISLALQDGWIRSFFPSFSCKYKGGEAIWRGFLQPREISPLYHVEIRYILGERPRVRILRPILVPGAHHIYPDGTLCLYWPEEWNWSSTRFIAKTIIPWTSQWLLYYELWLDTGKWLGPSSPHGGPKTI